LSCFYFAINANMKLSHLIVYIIDA
jgi:hypothetical protein